MTTAAIKNDSELGAANDPVQGFAAPGFEAVAEQFRANLVDRGDGGAAFSAVVDGNLVVDLWGGLADRDAGVPWHQETLAGLYSGSKGFVATCLLMLIERGGLKLDTPVCVYWPEFAARGKEAVLVRHVVSHQAGLPGLTTRVSAEEATDSWRMAELLAKQPLVFEPGTSLVYHALTFGWLCGELVRRVDGRSVGRFFREEVASPLALEAWIGLPAEHEDRVAVMYPDRGFGGQERDRRSETDPVAWSIWANPPRFSSDPLPANTRHWHAAEVPASSGIASARAVARLYGCLARDGRLEGTQILSRPSLELGSACLAAGVEPYTDEPMAFGVGFQLQTNRQPFGPVTTAYGHTGSGGSVHGAWPHARTGFSYVTNTLRESPEADARPAALLAALHDALGTRGNS